MEQLQAETSSVTFATGAGNSKAACTRFFNAASGTSSPIKADRMQLLRVTKSCSSSWSISGQFERRQLQREEQPCCLPRPCLIACAKLTCVVILKVVQFHALSQ